MCGCDDEGEGDMVSQHSEHESSSRSSSSSSSSKVQHQDSGNLYDDVSDGLDVE